MARVHSLCSLACFSFLVGRCLAGLDCSVTKNITCNRVENASLDTSEYYEKYKNCYWSFRDTNDTNHEDINPSSNIPVRCTLPADPHFNHLKVHCVHPKVEFLACYMLSVTNEETPSPSQDNTTGVAKDVPKDQHRHHYFVFIPVSLLLLVLVCLHSKRTMGSG